MNRILGNSVFNDERYALLLDALERAKYDLDSAYTNLSNAIEPDLIDCYIYEVQSVQMRYKFLLGRIKQIEEGINIPENPHAKNPLEAGS